MRDRGAERTGSFLQAALWQCMSSETPNIRALLENDPKAWNVPNSWKTEIKEETVVESCETDEKEEETADRNSPATDAPPSEDDSMHILTQEELYSAMLESAETAGDDRSSDEDLTVIDLVQYQDEADDHVESDVDDQFEDFRNALPLSPKELRSEALIEDVPVEQFHRDSPLEKFTLQLEFPPALELDPAPGSARANQVYSQSIKEEKRIRKASRMLARKKDEMDRNSRQQEYARQRQPRVPSPASPSPPVSSKLQKRKKRRRKGKKSNKLALCGTPVSPKKPAFKFSKSISARNVRRSRKRLGAPRTTRLPRAGASAASICSPFHSSAKVLRSAQTSRSGRKRSQMIKSASSVKLCFGRRSDPATPRQANTSRLTTSTGGIVSAQGIDSTSKALDSPFRSARSSRASTARPFTSPSAARRAFRFAHPQGASALLLASPSVYNGDKDDSMGSLQSSRVSHKKHSVRTPNSSSLVPQSARRRHPRAFTFRRVSVDDREPNSDSFVNDHDFSSTEPVSSRMHSIPSASRLSPTSLASDAQSEVREWPLFDQKDRKSGSQTHSVKQSIDRPVSLSKWLEGSDSFSSLFNADSVPSTSRPSTTDSLRPMSALTYRGNRRGTSQHKPSSAAATTRIHRTSRRSRITGELFGHALHAIPGVSESEVSSEKSLSLSGESFMAHKSASSVDGKELKATISKENIHKAAVVPLEQSETSFFDPLRGVPIPNRLVKTYNFLKDSFRGIPGIPSTFFCLAGYIPSQNTESFNFLLFKSLQTWFNVMQQALQDPHWIVAFSSKLLSVFHETCPLGEEYVANAVVHFCFENSRKPPSESLIDFQWFRDTILLLVVCRCGNFVPCIFYLHCISQLLHMCCSEIRHDSFATHDKFFKRMSLSYDCPYSYSRLVPYMFRNSTLEAFVAYNEKSATSDIVEYIQIPKLFIPKHYIFSHTSEQQHMLGIQHQLKLYEFVDDEVDENNDEDLAEEEDAGEESSSHFRIEFDDISEANWLAVADDESVRWDPSAASRQSRLLFTLVSDLFNGRFQEREVKMESIRNSISANQTSSQSSIRARLPSSSKKAVVMLRDEGELNTLALSIAKGVKRRKKEERKSRKDEEKKLRRVISWADINSRTDREIESKVAVRSKKSGRVGFSRSKLRKTRHKSQWNNFSGIDKGQDAKMYSIPVGWDVQSQLIKQHNSFASDPLSVDVGSSVQAQDRYIVILDPSKHEVAKHVFSPDLGSSAKINGFNSRESVMAKKKIEGMLTGFIHRER